MAICTYCGMILDETEIEAHSLITQIEHDANMQKGKDADRITKGMIVK